LSAEQVTRYPAPSLSYTVRPLAAGHKLAEGMVDCALASPSTEVTLINNMMPIMVELKLALHPRDKGGYIAVDMRLSCQ
jgi:hypothetical protein